MSDFTSDELELKFHGRIIDHLGIQMYTSPVAAIAELVANAWDADAKSVHIKLPESVIGELSIRDTGDGMTWEQCQHRYLNVGYCRRPAAVERTTSGRHVLGRKGIGKFAGFGIAKLIEIDTTSKATGERTVFALDVTVLRGHEYIAEAGQRIIAQRYPGTEEAKASHGTTITLKNLTIKRRPSVDQFRRSMARRFLLQQSADQFSVYVDDILAPPEEDLTTVQYDFPRNYSDATSPAGLRLDSDWGLETLPNGGEIRWRIRFYRDPIDEEELRGISVFAGMKLVQRPFFFNLSGGLGGQHGQEYMSGQVRADYLDEATDDIVATDRQQVTWEHESAISLLEWGQCRVKELLRIWKDLRGESKRKIIEGKLAGFSERLESLPSTERRTVKTALTKIGSMESLNDQQFEMLAEAMLKAWEQGRLRELINEIALKTTLGANEFLELLTEADVLTALNIAEVVKCKLESLRTLHRLVEKRQLENKLRDFIAARPYLLDPKWETFRKEMKVEGMLQTAAAQAGLTESTYTGRLDLALSGNQELLVVEFMRPGLVFDFDHASRCQDYVNILTAEAKANTALGIERVTGLIVADSLSKRMGMQQRLDDLKKVGILAYDWDTLLRTAEGKLQEFLEIVVERAPTDMRLVQLKADVRQPEPKTAK